MEDMGEHSLEMKTLVHLKMSSSYFALQQTENRSATLALTPLMLAERDREYLKQCRRFRIFLRNEMK